MLLPQSSFSLLQNLNVASGNGVAGASLMSQIGDMVVEAMADVRAWPDYAPTPLLDLGDLAQAIGVNRLMYKDEGQRVGVMSFKPLGAGYAVSRLVRRQLTSEMGRRVTQAELLAGDLRDLTTSITVACATDGNHGRAVAWAARTFGCRAVVYLASHVSQAREQAIASYGADVVRTSGNHDEAVRRVATDAASREWQVISETTNASSPEIAHDILIGYATLFEETQEQLARAEIPTHVFVQVGVGGLAAACAAYSRLRWGPAGGEGGEGGGGPEPSGTRCSRTSSGGQRVPQRAGGRACDYRRRVRYHHGRPGRR